MLVFIVIAAVYQGDYYNILGVYKNLVDANNKMDEYNDSSVPEYYAIVEEHYLIE